MTDTTNATTSAPDAMALHAQTHFNEHLRRQSIIRSVAHWVVLILSLALISFISYDTFAGISFLQNDVYMTFQFWVCVVFMADFVVELCVAVDRKRYLFTHIVFFLISIPYLNLLHMTGLLTDITAQQLYFLRFIPLVRGAYALAMVVGALSRNRATTLLTSYVAMLLSIIYFLSLIFYEQEMPVNSEVSGYWDALWWALMNVTTIGCDISPMTVAGQVCAVVLASSGVLMLPLFTVYISSRLKSHYARQQKREEQTRIAFEEEWKRKDAARHSAVTAADSNPDTSSNS